MAGLSENPGPGRVARPLLGLAVVLVLLLAPAAAAGQAPPGFIGISPQSDPDEKDYELMAQAGLTSIRLPLFWSHLESADPALVPTEWDSFDRAVEMAARYELRVMPFVWGTPVWLSSELRHEPVTRARERRAWASFLRRAVRRYGSNGRFWLENEDLPYVPIRRWEIWNEANIVTFGRADPERFARLIRISGRAIHAADSGAKVIVGGLFGRPLQVPPNVSSGDFLSRLYRARRVKEHFDGIALHPYVATAHAMRSQIRNLRRVMRVHNDGGTPLYVTELGWGSDSFESRWERGLAGQARELDRAFSMLASHRRGWRIGGVWWFSWADAAGACQFCDSAGLLTESREAKPSWYVFNAWTGGDPEIVPRATFGR
ncbi:MAG TPA: hypothetical protein VEQ41_07140 [Solirubrobacterales bacterium]|nr:hypothetical protein [Solirubrobacterales bacterium]